MNWMAGIKSKIRAKMGVQKQKDYFEKQRQNKRFKQDEMMESQGNNFVKRKSFDATQPQKKGKISMDIMALEQITELHVPDNHMNHDDYYEDEEICDELPKRNILKEHHVVPRMLLVPDRKLGKERSPSSPRGTDSPKQQKSGIKFFNDRVDVTNSVHPQNRTPESDNWSTVNEAGSKYSAYSGSPISQKRKRGDENESASSESFKWNDLLDAIVPLEASKSQDAWEDLDQVTPTYKTTARKNLMDLFEEEEETQLPQQPKEIPDGVITREILDEHHARRKTSEEKATEAKQQQMWEAELGILQKDVANLGGQMSQVIQDMMELRELVNSLMRGSSQPECDTAKAASVPVEEQSAASSNSQRGSWQLIPYPHNS